jgi:hypothetical protein
MTSSIRWSGATIALAIAAAAARRALEACRRVRVGNNRVDSNVLGRDIALKGTAASEVSAVPNQAWVR